MKNSGSKSQSPTSNKKIPVGNESSSRPFENLSDILSKAGIPYVFISRDFSFLESNNHFAALLGKKNEEITIDFFKSCSFYDTDKNKLQFTDTPFVATLKNGLYSKDIKIVFDEKEKWLRTSSMPIEDVKSKTSSTLCIISDTNIEIEKQLHINEALASIGTIIYSKNTANTDFNFISPALTNIFGFSPDEINNNKFKWLRSIHAEHLKDFKQFIRTLNSGRESYIEYRVLDRFGKEHWVLHSGVPIFKGNSIVRVIGIVQDITEEKQTRLKLEFSESRFRSLIDAADDLIFTLDGFGCFSSVNANGATALGYSQDELIGKHFLEFIGRDDESNVAEAFSKILQSTGITVFEATILDRFDKEVLFEIHSKPVITNKEVTGVLSIGRNISSRKNDEQKIKDLNAKLIEATRIISIERERARNKITVLEELNKLKSEFISNVSHELRTPLASIVGFAETISSDSELPKDTLKEFSDIILTEGKRLAKLINDLLDFSKLESGEDELHKEETNLLDVLNQLEVHYSSEIRKKNLTLTKEYPHKEEIIKADLERIKKVFSIILSNAIRYTNPGGRISILVQDFGKEIEIDITDTGIGIPEKDLPNIFQKFAKVHRSGSQATGAGLGLASIKQIIDLHKGFIKVRSEENKGTTFIIRLPK